LNSKAEEARVSDRSQAVAAAIVGTVGGAVVGYLLLTDRGRALRRDLEVTLDDAVREVASFRTTVRKVVGLAADGWKALSETVGDGSVASRRM
jgi:hypothetical protein